MEAATPEPGETSSPPSPTPVETPAVGDAGDEAATALPPDAPRLFLDCPHCDGDFMRENVAFVVYVRDRADADVHALVSTRSTGAGGVEYTLRFIGLGRFVGMEDEHVVFVKPMATDDERRLELARALRVGLARFAARTRVGAELDVAWAPSEAIAPEDDPWNHWVMSLNLSGFFVGESSYRNDDTNGSASAARVTELWKIRSSVYLSVNEERFVLGDIDGDGDVDIAESFQRNVGGSVLAGRGLGDHFTLGVRPSWSASTYNNIRSQYAGSAVAEWSAFPYDESTRRALVFQYHPRVDRAFYYKETIFGKHEETLFTNSASVTLDLTQPWGSVNASVNGSHYFHDIEKTNVYASLSLDLRLVRGLSLNLYGSLSLVRDQLFLPKADATPQEILLRRRQLATQYNYVSSVGLTYTFGSIFTPVVNTRLD
mgnify:CR=1 FL=1